MYFWIVAPWPPACRSGAGCKPVGSGKAALRYLAPYIFRVALSNRLLMKLENHRVTFPYTASQTGQTKLCTHPRGGHVARP